MDNERGISRPDQFRAQPVEAKPQAAEKPWYSIDDSEIDMALQTDKIQPADSLLIENFLRDASTLESFGKTERLDRLQSLRNRFTNAAHREVNPMDSDFSRQFTDKIEAQLSKIDPNWNTSEQDDDIDAIFNKALHNAAATSSQSPVRSASPDSFDQFLADTDFDDDLLTAAIETASNTPATPENKTHAPLTKLQETIRDSIKRGDGNANAWYENNADLILGLVQAGELTQDSIEKHRQVIEAAATVKKPQIEVKSNTTFPQLNLEYTRVLSQIKKGNLTSDQMNLLMEKKTQLESQISGFIARAKQKGLLEDIDSKYLLLQARLESYLGDLMDSEEKANFEKQVGQWTVSDKGKIEPEFQGVRDAYVQRLKGQMKADIKASKDTEEAFMKQVGNYSEASIQKRVEGIENRAPGEQRAAFRFFIEELEKTDKGRADSTTNNIMSELIKIAERKGISPEVKSEVLARIHLHSCVTSLRKVVTSETDKVGSEFLRASNEIGDYSLSGSDFETLLQDGLPGLEIEDSFQVLQHAAYEGLFSGKMDELRGKSNKEMLVNQILERHSGNPSFDRAAAEKSYDLAMKIAEATFELSVWDTSGGDYLSQAIYFSKWRAKDGIKGPPVTVNQIHSIGTSFLRNASAVTEKHNDRAVRIINKRDWNNVVDLGKSLKTEYSNVPVTKQNYKQGRYLSLALQRIQTEDDCVLLADQFYPDASERNQHDLFLNKALKETSVNLAEKPKGMLTFDKSDVHFSSMSKTAYREYLTSTIPSILKAKDLLTKVSITTSDLEKDNSYQEWAEILDRVDPNGVMSLRFWFIVGAISTALNSRMELSEVTRVARRLHQDKMSGKGVFTYLPQRLPDGRTVERGVSDFLSFYFKGLGNAIINVTERRIGTK